VGVGVGGESTSREREGKESNKPFENGSPLVEFVKGTVKRYREAFRDI